jgi:hypothetical protein
MRIIILIFLFLSTICAQDINEVDKDHIDHMDQIYKSFFKSTENISEWIDFKNYYYNHYINSNQIQDDGIFGEVFSEITVKLFTNKYNLYFSYNIYKDPIFNSFILEHINTLWLNDNLLKLKNNVQNNCPKDNLKICKIIKTKLDSLLIK